MVAVERKFNLQFQLVTNGALQFDPELLTHVFGPFWRQDRSGPVTVQVVRFHLPITAEVVS